MRTPTLQYLYMQKPVTLIVVICLLTVLPWIGLGDFATKGEPREAAVAVSMLEQGNWVLPHVYADEFAYKPPMAHWLMALFSYPQGEVTELTSRLPSALAFTVLVSGVLIFFGRRVTRFQEAFMAALILVTSIEIHRAAMTTRVDMLLTTFLTLGLFQLYRWEDDWELKGLPIAIPFLLGCATLTKGPVGLVLPLFLFGIYLWLLQRYNTQTIFKALLYVAVSSTFMPLLWYIAAWRQGGEDFLNVVLAENFGRFFHIDLPNVTYELGHEKGFGYNLLTLLSGFIPWSALLLFSLFGLSIRPLFQTIQQYFRNHGAQLRQMDKLQLFSLVVSCGVLLFFAIPSSKRSVYLMPAYPFISLFIARYLLYLVEYRTQVIRFFAAFLFATTAVVWIACIMTCIGLIHPVRMLSAYIQSSHTLAECELVANQLTNPDILTLLILGIVVVALITIGYQLFKKIHIKILYATFFLTFGIHLLVDGIGVRAIRNGSSDRTFAEELRQEFPLDRENMYVMNDLLHYRNLYGLNFYMGNAFHNFATEQPSKGYLLCAEEDFDQIRQHYGTTYSFEMKKVSSHFSGEVKQPILFCWFEKRP